MSVELTQRIRSAARNHYSAWIGFVYEDHLLHKYPVLKRNTDKEGPDFVSDKFYAEAKVGWKESGIDIKGTQLEWKLDKPLVYFCGFHQTSGLGKLYRRHKGRAAQSIAMLQFPDQFVISSEIIARFANRRMRENNKGTIRYCKGRPAPFRALLARTNFLHNHSVREPGEYYGINYSDYEIRLPVPGTIGYMLNKNVVADVLGGLSI